MTGVTTLLEAAHAVRIGQLDLDRVHFLGRILIPTLLALLQANHVYRQSHLFLAGVF